MVALHVLSVLGAMSSVACPPCTDIMFISNSVETTDLSVSHGWTSVLHPGGWTIVEATGDVNARAVGVGFYSSFNWECWDPAPTVPGDWVVFDSDSDSGDLLMGSIGASASTGSSPFSGISGNCSVSASATTGSYSKQDRFHHERWEEEASCVGEGWCVTLDGRLNAFELATGFGNTIRNYVFERTGPGDMYWERDVNYNMSVNFDSIPFCTPGPGPGASAGAEVLRVDFISVTTTLERDGASPLTTVNQGLLATRSDGTAVRLGIFSDPSFAIFSTPTGFAISGSASVDLTVSDPSVIGGIEEVSHDAFKEFDGDVDADGQVCWTDRELLYSLLGTPFGDGSYTPRADADLNGTIATADLEALNNFGCSADVNCDGVLDINDFLAYQDLFAAGDLSADMNGDGSLDIFDYTQFQTTFGLGCP